MSKPPQTNQGYRYPGTRPFYDNEVDRCLFFGREQEKESFLYKVLANQLVVLFSGSGIGKTSLINADLKQELRDRGFIPLMIRFNDPDYDPMQVIYRGIKEIVDNEHLDYEEGIENNLWEYFKTIVFFSSEDKLLDPVLILDQFEEFFMFYPPRSRRPFIKQLADIINNNIPDEVFKAHHPKEPFPYSDRPPHVKIVISIREDYLPYMEEMADDIPGIFDNRFRLLPLNREQACKAIEEPARLKNEVIHAASFTFTPEAVEMLLDFLCQRIERSKIKKTDIVEPFQLQLLCRHLEEHKVTKKAKTGEGDIIIGADDLGGEKGLQKILESFYDDYLEGFKNVETRKVVRRLFEEGLINVSSLEQEEIKRMFNISEEILARLVNSRLLRSESRGGIIYYELSQDTLIAPIRESQMKHQKHLEEYLKEGKFYYDRSEYDRVIEIYCRAIERGISHGLIYSNLARAYLAKGEKEKAIRNYKEAIRVDPNSAKYYEELGDIYYYNKKDFSEAIDSYKEALHIESRNPGTYKKLSLSYIQNDEPVKAVEIYKKAIYVDPGYAYIYEDITDALNEINEENLVLAIYECAFESGYKKASLYLDIGYECHKDKKYNEAIA